MCMVNTTTLWYVYARSCALIGDARKNLSNVLHAFKAIVKLAIVKLAPLSPSLSYLYRRAGLSKTGRAYSLTIPIGSHLRSPQEPRRVCSLVHVQ